MGARACHVHDIAYKNNEFFGRRFTVTCGAAFLPKLIRKAFYAKYWALIDTVNCDIRIMWGVVKLLLPCALLPLLERLAGLETRDQLLLELGKSKKDISRMSRGQAVDDTDKTNKKLMCLRTELRVAASVLEAYRPDVMELAIREGKGNLSDHSRICQIIEDQQIQCLEQ